MPATPQKGRRFGGDAAHQRLMMAQPRRVARSPPRRIVTTEAKAKALRPIAEKVHHQGEEGRRRPDTPHVPGRRLHR